MTKNRTPKLKIVRVRADELRIHPTAQRAIVAANLKRITAALDLDAIGVMHAVEYPIGGHSGLWVVDGQHRLQALLTHNFGEWPVTVQVHLDITDDARASALFLALQRRAVVRPYDSYLNELKAQEAPALGIAAAARKHRVAIAGSAGDGRLNCILSLKKLWLLDAGKTLDAALGVIVGAWGTQAGAMEGRIVEGMGLVLAHYGDVLLELANR